MKKLIDETGATFTELIASTAPAPGGGGASAMVGAIGIALGDMVGELTVGKKAYADVEEDMKELMKRAQKIRKRLLELVDEDAENFLPLSAVYKLPKDTPGRDRIMEECLIKAASAPMEILELACESILLQYEFAEKGSKIMLSDAATGVAMARAALEGAAVNVKVNTQLMNDRELAGQMNETVDQKLETYRRMADEVYAKVVKNYE